MLDSLRKASSGLFAKIMLGILAASFAVWGATDIFSGSSGNVLAKVGDTEITVQQFSRAFQQEVFDKKITQAVAKKNGLDRQVYSSLLTGAAFDSQLRDMKISISPALTAREIVNNPAFHDISGNFDRQRFDQYLRISGLSEQGFLAAESKYRMREWMKEVYATSAPVSKTMSDAISTYLYQKRVAQYFALPESAIGTVEAGDEAALKKLYSENEARFTAPEYRKVSVLSLEPKDVQDSIEIEESVLKEHYERNIKRFSVAEKRMVQQIPFSDAEAARQAYDKIKAGNSFEKVANEEGFESPDVNLGTVTQADIPDATIAQAAFALTEGEVSQPIKGTLSHIILKVTKITPGQITPFKTAKQSIKQRLQIEQSQEEVQNRHDAIEDARGEGLTFTEIAKKFEMKLVEIDAVDQRGFSPDGGTPPLPKNSQLLTDIYESDVGLENDPVSTTTEGYIWYEVLGVTKSRLKDFSEVKDDVTKLSILISKQKKLREKAAELIKKSDDTGTSFRALASSVGATVKTSKAFKRSDAKEVFSSVTLGILFATPEGQTAWAPGVSDIIILKTTKVIDQTLGAESAELKTLQNGLARTIQSDLEQSYITALREKYTVEHNAKLWQSIQTGAYAGGR